MPNVNDIITQAQANIPKPPTSSQMQTQSDLSAAQARRAAILFDPYNGPAGLNTSYPNEFEYYAVALEVCSVDAQGNEKTISYLSFPTMPSSLAKSTEYLSTIKKTASGVFVMRNTTFKPFPISIQGTFGSRLRYVDTQGYLSAPTSARALAANAQDLPSNDSGSVVTVSAQRKMFSQNIKTGYGTLKMLEKMLEIAHNNTNNIPNRLYWYNFAFNDMYLVEPKRFSPRQDRASNGMWLYNLELEALAPAGSIQTNLSNKQKNILSAVTIQKTVSETSAVVKSIFQSQFVNRFFNVPSSSQGGELLQDIYQYGSGPNATMVNKIGKGVFNSKINPSNR